MTSILKRDRRERQYSKGGGRDVCGYRDRNGSKRCELQEVRKGSPLDPPKKCSTLASGTVRGETPAALSHYNGGDLLDSLRNKYRHSH